MGNTADVPSRISTVATPSVEYASISAVSHGPTPRNAVVMGSWTVVEREAPAVAAVALRLWPGPFALDRGTPLPTGQDTFVIAYLATLRRDGAPRLHPFCPIVADGRLFAAIPRASPKGWDLRRDARCVIHATPGPDDDELCIRATASDVTADIDTAALVQGTVARSDVGGMVESVRHEPIFEFDLLQVDVARWIDVGQPGTHAERLRWRQSEH